MLILLKIVNVFLKVAKAVFHCVGILAVNYGVGLINLFGDGLVICRKSVCNVFIGADFKLLLISHCLNNVLNGVHTADEIALLEVKIAFIMNGS